MLCIRLIWLPALVMMLVRNVTSTVTCDIPCLEQDAIYPHPTDCSKYCHCSWGTPYEKTCPPDLLFNDLYKYCDWPENVVCSSSSTTKSTVTDGNTSELTAIPTTQYQPPKKKVVCYYTNWSQYRLENGFFPENINPDLCTHILFAFAQIVWDPSTAQYHLATYEWNDAAMYNRVIQLKTQNPSLRVMLSVGGYSHGHEIFANASKTESTRAAFIDNVIIFLREHKLDGLDVDWEYPDGSTKSQFSALLREIRQAFERESEEAKQERLLLSAAMASGGWVINIGYDLPAITPSLDFLNVMTYDYHGPWSVPQVMRHHSALYRSSIDEIYNIDWTIKKYLAAGVPSSKLVVGIPMYGRYFIMANPKKHDIGDPFVLPEEQTYSSMPYYKICEKRKLPGWSETLHPEHQVPYGWYDDKWVGFDDVSSAQRKAQYVCNQALGGIMIWSLDCDDFSASYCGEGKYPLLSKINTVLETCSGSS
ncbi:chitinase-3-like protein 1 [Lingula anatina]|uniref:Chitinase-3-like protein 1 n=1 Tax=Lingula anatina TaxID=7574 RepID=A0A1S3IQ13_LINAN|nr:chitinase-3-like protein 1 [Lingula anatina]|eukprot:XP_013400006.1 chitinase-3-like protein 1 [Lingula anatina]